MRRSLLAGLTVLICAHPLTVVRADWEYTKWGMTPDQVAAASRGQVSVIPQAQRKRISELKQETAAEGTYADGNLKLRVSFAFDTERGGLKMVVYGVMDPAQNDLLKDWLIQKHGPPQQSGGLPVIGLKTFQWNVSDGIDLHISTGENAFVMQSPGARN